MARLLAGFIGAGLFFPVVSGTLMGVWNLIRISADRVAPPALRSVAAELKEYFESDLARALRVSKLS